MSAVRIGGKGRKQVLSLEALPEIYNTAGECAVRADWDSLLPALGFDADEAELLQLMKVDGFTLREAAAHLRWSIKKGATVQRRIDRKLQRGPIVHGDVPVLPRASGVAFKHRLPSISPCHYVWSLTAPNPAELAIMRKERSSFLNH
jgi:hypothetical protein